MKSAPCSIKTKWHQAKSLSALGIPRGTHGFLHLGSFFSHTDTLSDLAFSGVIACLCFMHYRADTWDVGEWQQGGWRFMRVREDKNLANDISVIERIQRSRQDNIRQTEATFLSPHRNEGC